MSAVFALALGRCSKEPVPVACRLPRWSVSLPAWALRDEPAGRLVVSSPCSTGEAFPGPSGTLQLFEARAPLVPSGFCSRARSRCRSSSTPFAAPAGGSGVSLVRFRRGAPSPSRALRSRLHRFPAASPRERSSAEPHRASWVPSSPPAAACAVHGAFVGRVSESLFTVAPHRPAPVMHRRGEPVVRDACAPARAPRGSESTARPGLPWSAPEEGAVSEGPDRAIAAARGSLVLGPRSLGGPLARTRSERPFVVASATARGSP